MSFYVDTSRTVRNEQIRTNTYLDFIVMAAVAEIHGSQSAVASF
jgi:hypothetical protein